MGVARSSERDHARPGDFHVRQTYYGGEFFCLVREANAKVTYPFSSSFCQVALNLQAFRRQGGKFRVLFLFFSDPREHAFCRSFRGVESIRRNDLPTPYTLPTRSSGRWVRWSSRLVWHSSSDQFGGRAVCPVNLVDFAKKSKATNIKLRSELRVFPDSRGLRYSAQLRRPNMVST